MDEQRPEPETPMPDDPRAHPEQTVDALEERITGQRYDQRREDEPATPALEQDIDPADTDGRDMHRGQEPSA